MRMVFMVMSSMVLSEFNSKYSFVATKTFRMQISLMIKLSQSSYMYEDYYYAMI
ncbi:hypothetical protein [Trichoplusia ni ascovirus 6b]|nr:hypothetical protein [Trichoplusia ni ascovirus 6b]